MNGVTLLWNPDGRMLERLSYYARDNLDSGIFIYWRRFLLTHHTIATACTQSAGGSPVENTAGGGCCACLCGWWSCRRQPWCKWNAFKSVSMYYLVHDLKVGMHAPIFGPTKEMSTLSYCLTIRIRLFQYTDNVMPRPLRHTWKSIFNYFWRSWNSYIFCSLLLPCHIQIHVKLTCYKPKCISEQRNGSEAEGLISAPFVDTSFSWLIAFA